MTTKLGLKIRIKELDEQLELLHQENEFNKSNLASARLDNAQLKKEIADKQENIDNWRKIGKRIIYMIAYDLAEYRTHRQRNEQLRLWLATLKGAMENLFYKSEIDDIPF